jgi:hypothetical protein
LNAKRVATALVLQQVSTAKKLAKMWARREIDLETDLALDKDDAEELAMALQQLLNASAALVLNNNNITAAGSSSADLFAIENAVGYSPFLAQSSQSLAGGGLPTDYYQQQQYWPTEYDQSASYYEPHQSQQQQQQQYDNNDYYQQHQEQEEQPAGSLLVLDPTMVTQVDYDDDNEDNEDNDKGTEHPFVLTKEGYKSFHGGWIEGTTEQNEKYFYNLKTGASAWHLPALLDTDDPPLQSVDQVTGINNGTDNDVGNGEVTVYDANYNDYNNNYNDYSQHNNEYAGAEYAGSGGYDEYYDPHQQYYAENNYNDEQLQQQQQWTMSDAVGFAHIDDFVPPLKPRAFPSFATREASAFAKREGVARQLALLQQQDRWQSALVKAQSLITEQKSQFLARRVEMFDRVSERVDARLNAFIEDIKFMQKTLKKELGEANATERDLRRLFEEESSSVEIVKAEKLSFVLEALEKLKISVSEKYDSAFKQIDKFGAEWELIKTELLQVGDIYDEGILQNLSQCLLVCEHQGKLFVKDQLKLTTHVQKTELRLFRIDLRRELLTDSIEIESRRAAKRVQQLQYYYDREIQKEVLRRELYPRSTTTYSNGMMNATVNKALEEELTKHHQSPPIDPLEDMLTEEELCMSFLLTQVEMEQSLEQDYNSILQATKTMAREIQDGLESFDVAEKNVSTCC